MNRNLVFGLLGIAVLIAVAWGLVGCTGEDVQPKTGAPNQKVIQTSPRQFENFEFKRYEGPILVLDDSRRPYRKGRSSLREEDGTTFIMDDEGVPLRMYDTKHGGGQQSLVYHPVFLAQYALESLDVYRTTGEQRYLEIARRIAFALTDSALKIHGQLWFPYSFQFFLHGYKDQLMRAPWYSAMAQGQILSLLVALHEIQPDVDLMEMCHMTFRTLVPLEEGRGEPWCACVNERGHLWLEEYPMDPPANTLNGKIFALFGVYEYYLLTGSPKAESILRGSLATVKETLPEFRVEGDYSHYCLKHPLVLNEKYHRIHIRQLGTLARMTGDKVFKDMVSLLRSDAEIARQEQQP